MRYWRELDIDGYDGFKPRLLRWVMKETSFASGPHFWNAIEPEDICQRVAPELGQWITAQGRWATSGAVLFMDRPALGIHVDEETAQARLNIPLLNTENTHTIFYQADRRKSVEGQLATGERFHRFDDEDCTEVARIEMRKPTLIRVQEPHRVLCEHPVYPRLILTLKFNRDPVTLLDGSEAIAPIERTSVAH